MTILFGSPAASPPHPWGLPVTRNLMDSADSAECGTIRWQGLLGDCVTYEYDKYVIGKRATDLTKTPQLNNRVLICRER